jgi:hypothetical protein
MPTLDDAPILSTLATSALLAGDLLHVYDISAQPVGAKTTTLGSLRSVGLLASEVDDAVATTETINTKMSVVTGTTPTVTLPAVAGTLREVIVLNTASGNLTLDTPGSEKILTGTAEADTLVVATGKSAWLLSNGTRWYHVSNDA